MKPKAKIKGYAFIIKANGMPRIDNPREVPQENWDTLTLEQQNHANEQVSEEFRR